MRDLNDLYYFVQVVDHGGFAPAARALGMQKSKLSRRIAFLEDQLGTRLIQRSSRKFSVTEVGQEYYRHCLAMLVEAGPAYPVSLMHLIYRHNDYESGSKDYEFSRLSMLDHWRDGLRDAGRSLTDRRWTGREVPEDGLMVFDANDPHRAADGT